MINDSLKRYAIGLFSLTSLLYSCHNQLDDGVLSRSVLISFNVPVATHSSSQTSSTDDLNALIFKKTQIQGLETVRYIPVTETWLSDQNKRYKMQCQLETGSYHFSLSKGLNIVNDFVEGNQGEQCYWVLDDKPRASIDDYAVHHPINDDNTLKECKTELYLNTEDVKILQLINSNKSGEIELYHAQGRLDMVFVYKGKSTETSPFASIETLDLELNGLNASCKFSGESIELAGKTAKFCQQLNEENFSVFELEDYKEEFQDLNNLPLTDLAGNNQKRIKKWFFFPSSSVDGKLKVLFKNGYSQEFELSDLKLQRNWVTLIVVNITEEHLSLSPDGIGSAPLGDGGENDSGFWN